MLSNNYACGLVCFYNSWLLRGKHFAHEHRMATAWPEHEVHYLVGDKHVYTAKCIHHQHLDDEDAILVAIPRFEMPKSDFESQVLREMRLVLRENADKITDKSSEELMKWTDFEEFSTLT